LSERFLSFFPPEILRFSLVLFLSFLIGLEREELKRDGRRTMGGVRTFPIIGLVAYAMAYLSHGQITPMLVGFGVVAAFLFLSYWYKLRYSQEAGVTTEMSGLVVYLAADLVYMGNLWFAVTLVVACLLLLELKDGLEGLTLHIAPAEISAFTKFLLLTAVILPMVPNQDFGPFHLNPYKTWLVVLAVSGVSYGSYVLQRLGRGQSGLFLTGLLGGLYSSTATTVALARRAASGKNAHAYSGSILAASGVSFLRIAVLVWLFSRDLGRAVAIPFVPLGLVTVAAAWLWSRVAAKDEDEPGAAPPNANPLELNSAFFFAFIFVVMVVVTHLTVAHLGQGGIVSLAALIGLTDVNPFILSLTQEAGRTTTMHTAAWGILVATASNNLVKGGYAYFFTRGTAHTGRWVILSLGALAVLGLVPMFWL
jgi:uncharacterized membrane protein (DUF4010 family)